MTITTFPDSSFFTEKRAAALPTPAEIRSLNKATGHIRATNINSPPPVAFPSLQLFVKYGHGLTISEVETQIFLRKQLQQYSIPIPEVFGYAEDSDQVFLYMALIEGESLQQRFSSMNESERQAVCAEVKSIVQKWRQALVLPEDDLYIGSFGKRLLTDNFLLSAQASGKPGLFLGPYAWDNFHEAFHIEIQGPKEIVFTHNDLCPPNILLTKGPGPRVAAIIDFGQSGWYPWYWEYCKAKKVGLIEDGIFDRSHSEEWHNKYVPQLIDPVDDERYFYPWWYFALGHI